ncbi:hypothetical protein [Dactylosporangium darangshiense]|uniref:Uncharacterized protein n=1 Tax=Dactylosporangium darangshiense TaxID=579108 RepID=A0ABP8DU03_9ACTN
MRIAPCARPAATRTFPSTASGSPPWSPGPGPTAVGRHRASAAGPRSGSSRSTSKRRSRPPSPAATPAFDRYPDAFLAAWQSQFWLDAGLRRHTHAATAIARFAGWAGWINTDAETARDLAVACHLRSVVGLRAVMRRLSAAGMIHSTAVRWALRLPTPAGWPAQRLAAAADRGLEEPRPAARLSDNGRFGGAR